MNNLSQYIIEKLKINKDSKLSFNIESGDKVCFISLKQPGNYRSEGCPIEILINFPMTVDKIDIEKKKIKYYTDDNRKLETEYTKINKYEFIEDTTNNWETTIILNADEAILLLKELYKSTKRIKLDFLKEKYFEDISKLNFKYWNNEIRFITIIKSSIVDLNRKIITDLINAYENN